MLTRDPKETPSGPILELDHVSKFYRQGRSLFNNSGNTVTALNDVCLNINPGETFGLVGESGSGKSTIGRLILKLESPDTGNVIFKNKNIAGLKGKSLKAFRKSIQMICQDPYQSLNPYFNIYNTIAEPLIIHRQGTKKDRIDKANQLLEDVGLTPSSLYLHRYPHQLSGGQRQRVAIARAMVLEPDFIVADEPTSMLDATVSIQIYSILDYLKKHKGVTLLFITHNIAAARLLCDRIAVIYKGRIVETGEAEALIKNPGSDYTRSLINSQPACTIEMQHCR